MIPLPHKLRQGGFFMEGKWDVYFENEVVGTCSLERKGLYYHIVCRCANVATGICRLTVQCEDQRLDLGVMIPEKGLLCINRSIPAKNFPKGQPMFYIWSEKWRDTHNFIPVREGEVFFYLSQLEKVRFANRGGQVGVILTESY